MCGQRAPSMRILTVSDPSANRKCRHAMRYAVGADRPANLKYERGGSSGFRKGIARLKLRAVDQFSIHYV
jgi:hypothetical protein